MRKFKASYGKKYQDNQGQEKTSWKNIGFANEVISQDGKTTIHLTLDSIPTGNWDGDVKLFLQDENQNNQGGQQNYQAPQQQNQQQAYNPPPTQYKDASGNQQTQQQYQQTQQQYQ